VDLRIMLKAVVLPAPLGPRRAKVVPSCAPKLMSSTTTLPPNDFVTLMTCSASPLPATRSTSSMTSCLTRALLSPPFAVAPMVLMAGRKSAPLCRHIKMPK
jgi:hypothetical protein